MCHSMKWRKLLFYFYKQRFKQADGKFFDRMSSRSASNMTKSHLMPSIESATNWFYKMFIDRDFVCRNSIELKIVYITKSTLCVATSSRAYKIIGNIPDIVTKTVNNILERINSFI